MLLEENKPLAPYTTFGIGGPARWFIEAKSEDEIVDAADWALKNALPLFVLGGGSNLLVSDQGFDGLVMHVALRGLEIADGGGDQGSVVYRVASGEPWDMFVMSAVEANYAGVECLAGIPGTVGGTPVQNVGAYGQEVASVIDKVRGFDLQSLTFVEFNGTECEFGYRRSRFNARDRGRYVVTRVDFRLTPGGAPTLGYRDLQRSFPEGSEPKLAEVASAVLRIRRSKGMLLVQGDPDRRSAGSFFKNPVVSVEVAESIGSRSGVQPPTFPSGGGEVKIPAAWLVEHAGFGKGYVAGAAGVSSRHTLALINRGAATAKDVLALADTIMSSVHERFGVVLEMEPVMLGF